MNSLIHLSHQSPMSMAPGGLSSASRVHLSLGNGSLSVTKWSNKRSYLVVSRPLHVKCTLERFSEGPKVKEENNWNNKKDSNHSIMRGVGRASLVMACVLGAITLTGKINTTKPTNIAYAAWYQSQSRNMEKSFFKTERISGSDIKALKLWAMTLSMKKDCGDVGEKIISDECERFKDTPASNPLSLALIEFLVDQRKYEIAKQKIQELLADIERKGGIEADVPKAKIYLLKAIAESESEPEKATESWTQYLDELSSPFYQKKMKSLADSGFDI